MRVRYNSREEGVGDREEFDTEGELHLCEDCYRKLLSDAIEKLWSEMVER